VLTLWGALKHFVTNYIFTVWGCSPTPKPKLEDHPLSAVCDYLLNIVAATLRIGRPSLHLQPEDAPCRGDKGPIPILPVVLYGCETWSLILREEHRLRVFEKRVYNDELHSLYSSPNIVRVIKSRRMRWTGHVARMGRGEGFGWEARR
jgi:hypothetical protein